MQGVVHLVGDGQVYGLLVEIGIGCLQDEGHVALEEGQ